MKLSRPRLLIVGAGYVGRALGAKLVEEGWQVTGWTASEQSALSLEVDGIQSIVGDVGSEDTWRSLDERSPDGFHSVLYCPSSGRGGADAYVNVHRAGVGNLLTYLRSSESKRNKCQLLYTSSTSVYGQNDGSVVSERSLTEPTSPTSQILVEAEQRVCAHGGTVLRLAGIYGPGRSVHLRKLKAGTATIPGDASRFMNQIRLEDIVGGIEFFLGTTMGQGEIYNVCDNAPCSYKEFYEFLCQKHGKAFPNVSPIDSNRKRGVTNKRVSNAKLAAMGWKLKYPTYREGYGNLTLNDGG